MVLASCLCVACSSDSDCNNGYKSCESGECVHRHVFPMYFKETVGGVVLVMMSVTSAAAGLAGGTMIVPVMKIFFNFSQGESVALANTFMWVSTLT